MRNLASYVPKTAAQRLEVARNVLLCLLCLGIALFPYGKALQVIFPAACFGPLAYIYLFHWRQSTLAGVKVRWLLLLLLAVVGLQLVVAIDLRASFRVVSPNLYRSFVLVFAGLEAARNERSLKFLVFAFLLAAFGEGLTGTWQFFTGADLVTGDPLETGRLTGSFGGYRVGNYMGIVMVPAMAAFFLFKGRPAWVRAGWVLLLFLPMFVLWAFAQARMGYLAFVGGAWLLFVLAFDNINWKTVVVPTLVILVLLVAGPERVRLSHALESPRFQMWSVAWKTFQKNPVFGTGASSFEPALVAAGFTGWDATPEGPGFMHPHNAYVQFAIDGGVVGLAGMLVVFLGAAAWALVPIRRGVKAEKEGALQGRHWHLAAFFWAGWMGYLIVLAGGHDFYRTWFLAVGMTLLGILLGAAHTGPRSNNETGDAIKS